MGEFSFTVHPHGNTNRGRLPCLPLLWWSTLTSGFRRKFHFHVFLWGDCLGTENRVLSGGNEMTACPLLLLLEQQPRPQCPTPIRRNCRQCRCYCLLDSHQIRHMPQWVWRTQGSCKTLIKIKALPPWGTLRDLIFRSPFVIIKLKHACLEKLKLENLMIKIKVHIIISWPRNN